MLFDLASAKESCVTQASIKVLTTLPLLTANTTSKTTTSANKAMAPKSKKGANAQKSKGAAAEEEREESLQAVVFADSFETRFAPFTLERPRVRHYVTSTLDIH